MGREKGQLSKKEYKTQNKAMIEELDKEIELLQRYRDRMKLIKEGSKTIGQGIYTQRKRNAYKINPKTGGFGNLVIDLPNYMVS